MHTPAHIDINSILYTRMNWKVHRQKNSLDDVISAVYDFFSSLGSKHWNTNRRSMSSTRGETILKNIPHLVPSNECILVSLWTFQLTIIYVYMFWTKNHKDFGNISSSILCFFFLILSLHNHISTSSTALRLICEVKEFETKEFRINIASSVRNLCQHLSVRKPCGRFWPDNIYWLKRRERAVPLHFGGVWLFFFYWFLIWKNVFRAV